MMRAFILCVVCVIVIVPATAHSNEVNREGKTEDEESEDLSSPSEHEESTNVEKSESPTKEISTRKFSLVNIPMIAYLTERVRQSIYSAAGVLYDTAHPVRNDINRQAYNTAGALYQSGHPVRKMVANSKAVKTGGIVWEIWKQLKLKGKTRDERIKILVKAISEEIVNHVPLYTKINPLEIKKSVTFLCGVKGYMKDLTTIKYVDTVLEPIEDDGLRIKIDYTFTDLHFNYTKFHIHGLGIEALSANGWLDLKFTENNVRITLKIPKFSQIITNLMRKRCIVHITNLEVTNLVFVKNTLSSTKDGKRRRFLSGRIKKFLINNQDFLRARYELRALVSIHRALVTQDHWICKDKNFGNLVKSKGGSLDAFVPKNMKELHEYCGTDYYIEPYKMPEAKVEPDYSVVESE